MKEAFDFDRIGKRMPYTAPDGFLDNIEKNVWEAVKEERQPFKPKRKYRLWYSISAGLVAASIALLRVFKFTPAPPQTDSFEAFEQAFSQLNSDDQNYFFTTYTEDLFINN